MEAIKERVSGQATKGSIWFKKIKGVYTMFQQVCKR